MQTPEAVKTLRLTAGLTQVELCQLTGISPIDTNEAETGEIVMNDLKGEVLWIQP